MLANLALQTMQSFHAPTFHDLLRILGKNPIPPEPPRRKERTTEYVEDWVIHHFLVAVAESGLFEYPLCIEPGDRPDFVLSSRFGRTGIEITEAVPEDWVRVEAFLENKEITKVTETEPEDGVEVDEWSDFVHGARFVPPFRIVDEKRHSEEIENMVRNQSRAQNLPHMGDSIERNWIEAMMCIAKRKALKLASPGFANHPRNWLLIYDNWTPGVHGCHDVANPLARQLFNCEWRNPFEKIFILRGSGETVWEFSHNAEVMKPHGPGYSG